MTIAVSILSHGLNNLAGTIFSKLGGLAIWLSRELFMSFYPAIPSLSLSLNVVFAQLDL